MNIGHSLIGTIIGFIIGWVRIPHFFLTTEKDMAIIKDKESKFTVQLTGNEQLMWLIFHFGMLPNEAIEEMKRNQNKLFFVRLPVHVTNMNTLMKFLLEDEQLGTEFWKNLTTDKESITKLGEQINDRPNSNSAIH